MKSYFLYSEQRLLRPVDEVFVFFADARNLERLTPSWLRFEILTSGDVTMERGARIDYRIYLHGFPMRWKTVITAWEPPRRFVDEQLEGPYRLWVHEHTFEPLGAATVVRDCVQYAVPGGALIRRLFVAPDLERIFAFRREALARIFG